MSGRGPGCRGAGKKLSRADLAVAERLLVSHGIFPGDYLRRPPGERAVICAMILDHKRREEERHA